MTKLVSEVRGTSVVVWGALHPPYGPLNEQ